MTQHSIKSGLYWRRSWWNGRATVPVVLTAEPASDNGARGGTLTLRDADGGGFSVDAARVTASWSLLGTMTLVLDGATYHLVGAGSRISRSFTPAQRAELAEASAVASDAGRSDWASIAFPLGDVGKILTNTRPWRAILADLGARVR